MEQFISFAGFYLSIIGTWRLASATRKRPIGNFVEYADEENSYKPIHDLYAIHKVLVWIFALLKSFNEKGAFSDAVILQKQFNWGLFWLLLGISLQYVSGLL